MRSIIFGIVVGVVVAGGAFFVFSHYQPAKTSSLSNASSTQAQAEQAKMLLASVSKLILVPNEEPVIATINDAYTLIKEQPFYTGAQNGDVVFIFQKAAKAIVYSPSRNIIINVGPILPQEQTQPLAATTTTKATTTKKK